MSIPVYDSRDPACKTPFGAIPTGREARFTIHLPKSMRCKGPILKLVEMDHWDRPTLIPMELSGANLRDNSFSCSFLPEKPGLLFYYFELPTDHEVLTVRRGGDGAGYISGNGELWQLTVYDADMYSPPCLREGMIYQIFPDRFRKSGEPECPVPEGRTMHPRWEGLPVWRPNEEGEVTNTDYFGGNLAGIAEKLDYLASLGVTVLYLNPIFEAHSNHRYNTADYKKVDPLLGTNEDFSRLCKEAGERGISIVLDGVFSHTGSDSVYFNREGRYGDQGAYQSPTSPYCSWYRFHNYPDEYDCWWGFHTLPNVNETDPAYQEFICGENGVIRQWLNLGAAGFRLDVADELPDEFLDLIHDCVKSHNPDNVVIGEVWEDASNKVSYGVRRRYLLGGQLDSVMNYPFMDALLGYIRYGNGDHLYATVMQVLENYPKPAIQALMNSLSTHDTIRAITALGGKPVEYHDREWQEAHNTLTEQEYEHGRRLFCLASILQFGLPGMPCVYYGDEAGLYGYKDPFNRAPFPWGREDHSLTDLISQLGNLRRDHPIFAEADFVPLIFNGEVCAFARTGESLSIVFAVNRSAAPQALTLPVRLRGCRCLVQIGEYASGVLAPYSGVVLIASVK